jgi:beta-N-acetylhexosaminidase
MAIELRSIGVNVSWAPLADVHSSPTNPVIGTRAFGSDPEDVARKAVTFARALMDHGVLGCAKHFPGHGDTTTDSHHELPTVDLPLDLIRRRELPPFQALIDIDIPFVMTAHILFPQIDPVCPATLSPRIVDGLLRETLGFNNVVLGDDLDMKAIAPLFGATETVAHAMNAGCDMFCIARFPDGTSERPIELAKNMATCLTRRLITEDRLFTSFERIKRIASSRLQRSVVSPLSADVFARHGALRDELA